MGYGHHRGIYPLKQLAYNGVILNANNMEGATRRELKMWALIRAGYEYVSRASKLPVIGILFTKFIDKLLYIPNYYPSGDRSGKTFQVKLLKGRIRNGLGAGVISRITDPELPLVTSFYSIAIAADMAGHKKIFCIICDTDISRVWVSEKPYESNIEYFASGSISEQRLLSYGVPSKNIHLTGFPLPLELLGDRSLNILKKNLIRRLMNLDHEGRFYNLYKHSINAYLDYDKALINNPLNECNYLTITFAVGGAGAQKEIGRQIAESLSDEIARGKIKLNLVAGTRKEIFEYYDNIREKHSGGSNNIKVIWDNETEEYFNKFNQILPETDVLWTKPSEMSFYSALGIPLILTPPIGPQEKCNRRWLRETGSGFKQLNIRYTNQWLGDLHRKGKLAEAAWLGFLKGRKYGTYNIIDLLQTGAYKISNDPLQR